jgi:hypothetical protein
MERLQAVSAGWGGGGDGNRNGSDVAAASTRTLKTIGADICNRFEHAVQMGRVIGWSEGP